MYVCHSVWTPVWRPVSNRKSVAFDQLISITKGTEGGFILLTCTPALVRKTSCREVHPTCTACSWGSPGFQSLDAQLHSAHSSAPSVRRDCDLQHCHVTQMKQAVLHPWCPKGALRGEASVSGGAALDPGALLQLSESIGMCDTPSLRLPELWQHAYM